MKIVLDADGVMLDYNTAYIGAWTKAFGVEPTLVNPKAYWATDRYDVRMLSGSELLHFRSFFDEEFWENVPALPGAVDGCNALAEAGFEIICVSALDKEFGSARLRGLQKQGFKIGSIFATGNPNHTVRESPKAEIVNKIMPVAFVDDFIMYHEGISDLVHRALITREEEGSPNNDPELVNSIPVDSKHINLKSFSDWFLNGEF
jgi:phosphoglycolate phosphatase-like HAD superfamily hydrolase